MKKIFVCLLALPMAIGPAGDGRGGLEAAARKRAFLEREIALAKSPGLYVVIDFDEKAIVLKGRGAKLKSWDIIRSKTWGRAVGFRVTKITRKSALFPPKRAKITPKPGEEAANVELDVLELDKMPAVFSIYLEENIRLKVRPRTRSFLTGIRNIGEELGWYMYLPLKTVGMSVAGKKFSEIEIVTRNEIEAKGIYWAFYEGLNCLIYEN